MVQRDENLAHEATPATGAHREPQVFHAVCSPTNTSNRISLQSMVWLHRRCSEPSISRKKDWNVSECGNTNSKHRYRSETSQPTDRTDRKKCGTHPEKCRVSFRPLSLVVGRVYRHVIQILLFSRRLLEGHFRLILIFEESASSPLARKSRLPNASSARTCNITRTDRPRLSLADVFYLSFSR